MTGDTQPYGYIWAKDPAGLLFETRSPRLLNNKQHTMKTVLVIIFCAVASLAAPVDLGTGMSC